MRVDFQEVSMKQQLMYFNGAGTAYRSLEPN